ncbi:MAG: glycosyltransferase family 4 protein [Candidatus Dormibacteraeota bacterium]|uniref:Glycosyltransferase family 4 protein n=1 Tax=Candidatus Aeolococcus gillhamiae TaxID=3127015 RepID=A0A934K4G4_9BACT|nr:glycosyltransferase family 4 protein [Candidatus Dormibacteraeota bacterium]
MRIAYVCADRGIPVLGHKGASVHVREVTAALQAIGHRVMVLCARVGDGNPAPDVQRLEQVDPPIMADPEAVRDLLETFGAEAVLERYALESGAARSATAVLGIPHVLEVNAPLVLEAARYRCLDDVAAWLAREREIFTTTDAVVVVQRQLAQYVHAVAPAVPVTCVPNGVRLEGFANPPPVDLGLPAGSMVIGFVGSMKPWHGVDDLVSAFAAIANRHPRAHLVMVGQGPETGALRRRITDEGLGGRVHLVGAVGHDRIPAVLGCFDIAVAPFRPSPDFYFGPLKVYEYLAAGLPIVYPAIGDMPGTIGAAGVAYEAGDVAGLAGALDGLLADPRRRAQLGAAARVAGSGHSWTSAARSISAVIAAASGDRIPATAPASAAP